MKLLLLLLSVSLFSPPKAKFVLIDRGLKKPPVEAEQFAMDRLTFRTFPIYSEDVATVAAAAETAAKKLQQKMECIQTDTVTANHSWFIITSTCQPYPSITVRLRTRIDEQKLTCDFELIQGEFDYRKIQRQLLDFSEYLSN